MSFSSSANDYTMMNHNELVDRLTHLEAQFQQETSQLRERNALLEEQLRWFQQQVFGRSSEKQAHAEPDPQQGRLFNEAEAIAAATPVVDESVEIPAHTRKKRGRKKLPDDLPRIEVVHDLPADEKVCSHDGLALQPIGEEVSEQLDYIPAKVRVIKHIRLKYACPGCDGCIKVAAKPAQLLPKSNASPALLAQVVTAKYVDGLPLHRQEKQFARLGLSLSRASMANWMIKLGDGVMPLVNLLDDQIRAGPLIHCDETSLQVLKSPGGDQHWMWVRVGGPPDQPVVLFDHDPSRGAAVPKRLLADFHGILLTDGYEPYELAARAGSLIHAGCWAHVRRYFKDAQRVAGRTDGYAQQAVKTIGALYRIERDLRTEKASWDERLKARQKHSRPIVEDFKAWLEALAREVVPQGALGKAVHYALHQWPKLIQFLDHGEIPMDNNRAENAIRPFVIGRKAWLFSDTPAGADASARLYTLVETAKANGLEPHAYLAHLFAELPKAQSVEDIEALLPWNAKAAVTQPS